MSTKIRLATCPPATWREWGLLEGFESSVRSDSNDSFLTADRSDEDGGASGSQVVSEGAILMVKYVDDTTAVETVNQALTAKHFTTTKTTKLVPAVATEDAIEGVAHRAAHIGMRVNGKKTQAVRISPDNGCSSYAVLTVRQDKVPTTDSIKLLRYTLSTDGIGAHIQFIKSKFRAKFWRLLNLCRSGIEGKYLFCLYCIYVRPVLEANSVVFHSMLTQSLAADLEHLQKMVVRLCFGAYQSCPAMREQHNIST